MPSTKILVGMGTGVADTTSSIVHMVRTSNEVRRAVAGRRPADDVEAHSIAVFLEDLDRLDRPFDEQADGTHVTASAFVLDAPTRSRILLHRHKRLGIWLQPGGHIDLGECPPDAACREVLEETGLVAVHPARGPTLAHVDVHPGPRCERHLDLRFLLLADGDPDPPAGESQDVRWFGFDDAVSACRWLDAPLAALDRGQLGGPTGHAPSLPRRPRR